MLNNANGIDHIYIACGYTDLRSGIDRLVGLVQSSFKLDPYQNSLFLFCGRRTDRIKGLLYKRLETGSFQWPRSERDLKELTDQQFRWLTEGLCIEQQRAIPKVYPGTYSGF